MRSDHPRAAAHSAAATNARLETARTAETQSAGSSAAHAADPDGPPRRPVDQDPRAAARRLASRICAKRRGYLLTIARRNATCEADAEEALQEAFRAFLEHYDPAGGAPPLAWLTLTLKRACWQAGRARRRELADEVRDEDGTAVSLLGALPDSCPETEARVVELDDQRRRLRALKPDERDALGLKAAGYSYAEIGARRGWTHTKVNRCLAEGRAALRSGG